MVALLSFGKPAMNAMQAKHGNGDSSLAPPSRYVKKGPLPTNVGANEREREKETERPVYLVS